MKIWLQMVSSTGRLPKFLAEVQSHCDSAVNPGTQVTVSGTQYGALGDQHAAYLHFDAHDILKIMHQRVEGKYDVYALGNSLDPALDALRELLDIPVLSLMQVGCSVATMLGDRIGVVSINTKFGLSYRRLIEGYGFGAKLGGIRAIDVTQLADRNAAFEDRVIAQNVIDQVSAVARDLLRDGVDVLLVPGSIGSVLAKCGVTQIEGAIVVDLYRSLVKAAEAVGYLAAHCGMSTSRVGRYQAPSPESRREAIRIYGLHEAVRTGRG